MLRVKSEFTFDPQLGLDPADAMLLFRTATKQICRRNGLHATFMTKPALPNFFSSGWHLHQSLVDADGGGNAFTNRADDSAALSELGRHFVGGLLEHAGAGSSSPPRRSTATSASRRSRSPRTARPGGWRTAAR